MILKYFSAYSRRSIDFGRCPNVSICGLKVTLEEKNSAFDWFSDQSQQLISRLVEEFEREKILSLSSHIGIICFDVDRFPNSKIERRPCFPINHKIVVT